VENSHPAHQLHTATAEIENSELTNRLNIGKTLTTTTDDDDNDDLHK
jgi:hypothetical protein